MDLGSIMVNEISQRKTNAIWAHIYVKLKQKNQQQQQKKNPKLIDTENRLVVARGERWGVGKMHEEG